MKGNERLIFLEVEAFSLILTSYLLIIRLQMKSISSIFASTLLFALVDSSNAFAYNLTPYRIQTLLSAETALKYRQGSDTIFSPSLIYVQSTSHQPTRTEDNIELQIEVALNNARDMDRRYGLCTQASREAWEIVDELYRKSAASQEIEDCVKSCLGTKKSVWNLNG